MLNSKTPTLIPNIQLFADPNPADPPAGDDPANPPAPAQKVRATVWLEI